MKDQEAGSTLINYIVILFQMEERFSSKKYSDGQLALYRLLRLQNKQNNFHFRDDDHRTYFKVTYQHFPLQTVDHNDLLKIFWKFITTHYFKKIDQEEIQRLNYLRNVFRKYQTHSTTPPLVFEHFSKRFKQFWSYLQRILAPSYVASFSNQSKLCFDDTMWLKRLYYQWCTVEHQKRIKTKKIFKLSQLRQTKKQSATKKLKKSQLEQEQQQIDQMINQLEIEHARESYHQPTDSIDHELARLQALLQQQSEDNITLVNQIQARIIEEEQETRINQQYMESVQNAKCLEWLIHNLQAKQIAESISKVVSCERKEGELKFQLQYQAALNLVPVYLKEAALKKINHLRQTSLFKFYRTGVKSLHSYISHNYTGFLDLCNERTSLSKFRDKDYLQNMKKCASLPYQLKKQFDLYEICHHCKFIYPPYMLITCRFTSDKQAMPKLVQGETDLGAQLTCDQSLQKPRVSQRSVTKHRNCMTGYAWVNEEYVCGRKFCLSCLKDNYGKDWMKLNNGNCPFCEGICSCTRCLRNQNMNKLKTFYINLGGNISVLQSQGLIQKLVVKKQQPLVKPKSKITTTKSSLTPPHLKAKKIRKLHYRNKSSLTKFERKPSERLKHRDGDRTHTMLEEETERWSSTAEKQLQNSLAARRTSSRKRSNYSY